MILVTGKGGTGKSVLAAALALYFANAGKRVWLAELGRKRDRNFSRLHELFGLEGISHTGEIVKLPKAKGQLKVLRLDPSESLAEYVALKIPGGALAGALLKNRVTASLLEIVPGLVEIVTLGKLWHSVTQSKAPDAPDLVIIDGPATGHAMTLVESPRNFARLTRQGPLFRDATAMETFLTSKDFATVLVSLPEVMPLSEAEDLLKLFGSRIPVPLLFVNKCMPETASKQQNPPAWASAALRYRRERFTRESESLREFKPRLKNKFSHTQLETIPLLFPDPHRSLAERINETWENP